MQYYIKSTAEMGRGLYALTDLDAGKILFSAELLVLSPDDTIKVNETDLKYYTFKYNDTQDCLVLGDGEIFNHNDTANIGYRLVDSDGRKIMLFYTLSPILAHDQLFINYSADIAVQTESYVNKNLIS
jgi:SET domain-containing protein